MKSEDKLAAVCWTFVLLIVGCLSLNSCAKDPASGRYELTPGFKANLAATGKILGQAAIAVATKTVDAYAQSEIDALIKNNFVQSSGDALRSLENTAATQTSAEMGHAVQQILEQWLPDKSHWQKYGDEIAKLISAYAKAHPEANRDQILEAVALGLQSKKPAAP